eukprot:9236948-Pyramimonas_sp.AAC.1
MTHTASPTRRRRGSWVSRPSDASPNTRTGRSTVPWPKHPGPASAVRRFPPRQHSSSAGGGTAVHAAGMRPRFQKHACAS